MKMHSMVGSLILAFAFLAAPEPSICASPIKLSGAITGLVTDSSGVPQMGAAVYLFNKQERLFEKAFTDERGEFRFLGLFPDLYSVRVSLANFVPAMKNNVLVQSGMRSILNVNLNGLFSSIQLVYPPTDAHGLMSDDWKWVLRSAASTRPVLRFLPELQSQDPQQNHRMAVFSDTRGLLKVSAGDSSSTSGTSAGADLGTAFALATSLFGNHMVQVAGNLGYGAASGAPAAAFRTSYSRNSGGASPEVSVTMRQLYLPGRLATGITGGDSNLPMLRTMSVSFDDRAQLSDNLEMQYGFSLDSVSFLDHLNYFSPYARLVYSAEDGGKVEFAYTSGNARPDLAGSAVSGPDAELQRDINALSLFPRISLRGGRAKVQRGEDFELSYTRVVGSRTFRFSGYREVVSNAALTMSASGGLYSEGDILPDLFSGTSIFNAGNYQSVGYSAAVTQNLGENLSASLIYGSMGALTAESREIVSDNPDELRAMIHAGRRHAATVRVAATSPWTGTHLIASYQWTDHRWLAPGHLYSTASVRPLPGLNIYLRQPIPMGFLPWRMEATADLRNLLAQGYLPLNVAGQQVTLVQTPRSFRGGLSFIF
jgi:hypothetical protein